VDWDPVREKVFRTWFEGLAARARGDAAAAHAAFASARVEAETTVREQPEYGPSLCVLE